jgi:hypothetical protein
MRAPDLKMEAVDQAIGAKGLGIIHGTYVAQKASLKEDQKCPDQ